MGGAVSVLDIESERQKPVDASDITEENAKEEVIRLRKLLHAHMNQNDTSNEFNTLYKEPPSRPQTGLKRSNSFGDTKKAGLIMLPNANRPGSGGRHRTNIDFGVETVKQQALYKLSDTSSLLISIGDIAKWMGDAIVNAATESMLGGGGLDNTIQQAAGEADLKAACEALPQSAEGVRCPTGEARVTPSFNLKCNHLIHAVGPKYLSAEESAVPLANAYKAALALANGPDLSPPVKTIAFPAISTGVFGYPSNEAAQIAVNSIKETIGSIERVEIVIHSPPQFQIFVNEASKILGEPLTQSLVGGGDALELPKKS